MSIKTEHILPLGPQIKIEVEINNKDNDNNKTQDKNIEEFNVVNNCE